MGVKLGFHEALLRASFTPSAMRAAVLDLKKQRFLPNYAESYARGYLGGT